MRNRTIILIVTIIIITAASMHLKADTGACEGVTITLPFTDVMSSIFFCQIAEAYFSGLTNGTTPTTYSPTSTVTREQMAAFITRTMDQSIKRKSKRAALDQFWTTQDFSNLGITTVGQSPSLVQSDGADLWVANTTSNTVSRVRASDGQLLETWTGATNASGVLVAQGQVFVTGRAIITSGTLYVIDPTQPAGTVSTVSTALGGGARQIAYDGQRVWTANLAGVSIVALNPTVVTNVSTGFSHPSGILFDGANIWVTDSGDNKLKQLDSTGNVLLSVAVDVGPTLPVFDGTNIWVPNNGASTVSVVRASGGLAGTVLTTLTGNGLNGPQQAAFDGERILVANFSGDSVSLWQASDFTEIGTFFVGSNPLGACSDGLNFWLTFSQGSGLARF